MVKKHRRIWTELLNRKRHRMWTELPNRKKHQMVKKASTELPNRKRHRIWTALRNPRKHQMAKKHRMVKKHRILRMVETFGMNLNPYFRPLRRAQDQRNRKRYRRVWTELQNQRKHQMVKKHR